MSLSEDTKKKMIEELADSMMDGMFGDGLEHDYVMYGFPEHKGLNNMTDQELLDEFKNIFIDENEPEDYEYQFEIYEDAKRELGL